MAMPHRGIDAAYGMNKTHVVPDGSVMYPCATEFQGKVAHVTLSARVRICVLKICKDLCV